MGVVLLDTSAVVGLLQPDDALHAQASAEIHEKVRAGHHLAISVVTLTELFTGAVLGRIEEQIINGFLGSLEVRSLPVDDAIARRAAQIRGESAASSPTEAARPTIQTPDALILATADLHPDVEIVVGGDRRWAKATRELDVTFVDLTDRPRRGASRSGLTTHAAVARHRRARLFGATIEAVSRQGYKGTTIAHIIALAGVSRRAFYEQFDNKEDCFLGTYDIAVARAKKRALEGWQQERGWANRMHRSFEVFFEDALTNSKATRLVLTEGLGLGVKSRERLLRSSLAFERMLVAGLRVAPDGVQAPPLAPRVIVGGGRYVMSERLLTGRESELPGLTDELLDLVSAYRSPAAVSAIRVPAPSHVPARPARFLESEGERARVLGAVVHLVLDGGYGELTDAQLAHFAGVSTRALHQQFSDKQECLLAVVDAFGEETSEAIATAAAAGDSWPEAAYLGVRAGVEHLTRHPGLTRLSLIDIFETGPAVAGSISRLLRKLSQALAKSAPEPVCAPAIVHEAVAGAMWAVVLTYAHPQRVKYLPSLTDHVAFAVLAPYVGPQAAAATIETMKT